MHFLTSDVMLCLYAGILSYLLAVGFGGKWISLLKRMKAGQHIREDGPSSHLEKAGTPSMGAVIFMSSFFAAVSLLAILQILTLKLYFYFVAGVFSFAFIGFYDDYKKIKKKENEGLTAKGKMLIILIITAVFYMLFLKNVAVEIPFLNHMMIENSALNFLFFLLLFSAMTNASNFSDGLDGLLASVTIAITLMFAIISYLTKNFGLLGVNLSFGLALLGYLKFNWHPAKVFMGDFGSIAIGSYVVLNAIKLNVIWFIPIFAFWYVLEVVSVILQVVYFKKTKKRLFKMAPFHHHLELCGWSEKKVVIFATQLTAVLCIVSMCFILWF